MEKICPTCKTIKKFNEFNKNKKRKDGLQSYCKQCQSEYEKDYYKFIDKDRRAINVKARIDRIQEWLTSYKQTQKCQKCDNSDFRVLEFHHKENKVFNIGDATQNGYGIDRIKIEIDKCQCLCANCHRILTYEERKKC
jgi:hypothetical protein